MRFENSYGAVIEMRFYKIENIYHSRIVGERLTNCGIEWPTFGHYEEELPRDYHLCEKCDRVIRMIQAITPRED